MKNKFYTNTETDEKQKKSMVSIGSKRGRRKLNDSYTNFTFKYEFNVLIIKMLSVFKLYSIFASASLPHTPLHTNVFKSVWAGLNNSTNNTPGS